MGGKERMENALDVVLMANRMEPPKIHSDGNNWYDNYLALDVDKIEMK